MWYSVECLRKVQYCDINLLSVVPPIQEVLQSGEQLIESRMNGPRESHVVGKLGHYAYQGGPWHDYKLYAP